MAPTSAASRRARHPVAAIAAIAALVALVALVSCKPAAVTEPELPANRATSLCTPEPIIALPGEEGTTALYRQLFAEGACFRYDIVHHSIEDDEEEETREEKTRSTHSLCYVAEVRELAKGTAADLQCTTPNGWERDLAGYPPIAPVVAPARVYLATPRGLFWSSTIPESPEELDAVLKDPLLRVLPSPLRASHEQNKEDEDVSYSASVERNEHGNWCWSRGERDDYHITDELCFARGALVRAIRSSAEDSSSATTTYTLVE